MTHQTFSGSTAEPSPGPYGSAPVWTPTVPTSAAGPAGPDAVSAVGATGGSGPRRPTLRDRVVKTWHALAVAAACLVVGLGVGAVLGHVTSGSGSDGTPQPPAIGNREGPAQGYGRGGRSGREGLGMQSDSSTNGSVTAAP